MPHPPHPIAQANVWNVPSGDYYYINSGNAAKPTWASSIAVVQSNGFTTLCFARPLIDPTAVNSPSLSADSPNNINMIYAVAANGVTDLGAQHTYSGGLSINLATGEAATIELPSKITKMNIHGALMAVAWILLLPLGSLIARHR